MLVLSVGIPVLGIAAKLEKYPQYDVRKIIPSVPEAAIVKDDGMVIKIPLACRSPEDYENFFDEGWVSFLEKYNNPEQEVLAIVPAHDFFSAIILKLLKQVQKAKISVLLIKTDLSKARKKDSLHQRAMVEILQQYARSALFTEVMLVDYAQIQSILGNVSIIQFLEKSIEMIASSFHMISVLKNQTPVFGMSPEAEDYERISTMGVVDLDSGEEDLLFQMKDVSSKSYLFFLNKDKVESDSTILEKIDSVINQNARGPFISYGVYTSKYENDYAYVIARTGNIQQEGK